MTFDPAEERTIRRFLDGDLTMQEAINEYPPDLLAKYAQPMDPETARIIDDNIDDLHL